MASILALVAAFLFALAATLQQKGALNLSELSLRDPASLARLVGQTTWLLGTGALLIGYVFQAAALDRGRLSIIQPLLVMTIVFALPLGYFLTSQHVGRKEVLGAAVIVVGLALFAIYGDPAGGRENAPGSEWAIAITIIVAVCVVLLFFGGRGGLTMKAAVYGTVAGILFGLSAALTKPTLDFLHAGIDELLTHWEPYALAIAGIIGFVLQQISLGTGKLAPSVATVSVANPVVGILLGVVLLEERLSRPAWHVVVACIGLGLALAGAVVISVAREAAAGGPERPAAPRRRPRRVGAVSPSRGFVLQQRDDGVRPVGDVVQGLLIANRPEPGEQDVQFSAGERASRTSLFADIRRPEIGFGLSCRGEEHDSLVVPGRLAELFQELVDPSMPLGRERGDRLCQVRGVVVGRRHDAPGRIRTSGQRIRSPSLCPLSYGRSGTA